jgi:hypothetical protein
MVTKGHCPTLVFIVDLRRGKIPRRNEEFKKTLTIRYLALETFDHPLSRFKDGRFFGNHTSSSEVRSCGLLFDDSLSPLL